MYKIYLGSMLFPLAPGKINVKTTNKNKTITLINEGEVNILKEEGLKEISFTVLIPQQKYPFGASPRRISYYIDRLTRLKNNKNPCQFIVTRRLKNKRLYDTNIKVAVQDFTVSDDEKEGVDVIISISLKEYKAYGTKIAVIKQKRMRRTVNRSAETNPSPKNTASNYTVKPGDCLWNIAKKYYGDGSKYHKIAAANAGKIKNPNLIYPNQVLVIPV